MCPRFGERSRARSLHPFVGLLLISHPRQLQVCQVKLRDSQRQKCKFSIMFFLGARGGIEGDRSLTIHSRKIKHNFKKFQKFLTCFVWLRDVTLLCCCSYINKFFRPRVCTVVGHVTVVTRHLRRRWLNTHNSIAPLLLVTVDPGWNFDSQLILRNQCSINSKQSYMSPMLFKQRFLFSLLKFFDG
jgi:hypothetical protein